MYTHSHCHFNHIWEVKQTMNFLLHLTWPLAQSQHPHVTTLILFNPTLMMVMITDGNYDDTTTIVHIFLYIQLIISYWWIMSCDSCYSELLIPSHCHTIIRAPFLQYQDLHLQRMSVIFDPQLHYDYEDPYSFFNLYSKDTVPIAIPTGSITKSYITLYLGALQSYNIV